jgi:uncharacterized membrane protein
MRMRVAVPVTAFLLGAAAAAHGQVPSRPDTVPPSVVRAVLFFSTTCPHCRDLITNGLPPIISRYGARLHIVGVNVASSEGNAQYEAMVERFGVTPDRQGVPTLVVGTRVLVGALEIPTELPGLVDRGLASGGVDWPDIPLLRRALVAHGYASEQPAPADSTSRPGREVAAAGSVAPPAEAAPAAAPTEAGEVNSPAARAAQGRAPERAARAAPGRKAESPEPLPSLAPSRATRDSSTAAATAPAPGPLVLGPEEALPAGRASVADRFLADPIGNSASVIVLLGMAACLALAVASARGGRITLPPAPGWTVPLLAVVGIGVAAYLSFVEVTGVRAVCGPVGDCNTVQQSVYARLLGVPIGVLGIAGYVAIITTWALGARGSRRAHDGAWLAVWMMAVAATAFSIYLTFLEPFVIGATCAWCLSSAVIVTLILIVATPRAARVLHPGSDAPA